jgi:NAD(P)-dependent dehydrogenase (short-subunit alcohol dehydrogenase family)
MSSKEKKYDSPLQATITGILGLFKKQERVGDLTDKDTLEGKTVLITGASSGLGLAVAKQLAALGGEVIMAVRSGIPERGEEVKKYSGSSKVHMLPVDLSDFDSIQDLVKAVKNEFGQIDVLICNAAVVVNKARRTKYDLDEMFTVNYLAKFILVNGLLKEKCFNSEASEIPRIIFVSSESHRNPSEFEWDTFGEFKEHSMSKTVERYGYYKLLMTTFSQELARRLNKEKKTVYSVFALCPGPVNSNIAREAPKWVQPPMKLVFRLFFNSPMKAAEPVVYLTASRVLEGKATDYLFLMSRKEIDQKAQDPLNGARLWEATEKLLSKFISI